MTFSRMSGEYRCCEIFPMYPVVQHICRDSCGVEKKDTCILIQNNILDHVKLRVRDKRGQRL